MATNLWCAESLFLGRAVSQSHYVFSSCNCHGIRILVRVELLALRSISTLDILLRRAPINVQEFVKVFGTVYQVDQRQPDKEDHCIPHLERP